MTAGSVFFIKAAILIAAAELSESLYFASLAQGNLHGLRLTEKLPEQIEIAAGDLLVRSKIKVMSVP